MQQYTKHRNVVVIGAGLGGLSAAISLASEGFQVELVEKNDKVGGKLNILEKDGFTFDLGPSILTMPHIFEALFTRVGKRMADYVAIEAVETHWRNFSRTAPSSIYARTRKTSVASWKSSVPRCTTNSNASWPMPANWAGKPKPVTLPRAWTAFGIC